MANLEPPQGLEPIFNGFPGDCRHVSRNCALKALVQEDYDFVRTEIRLIAEINSTRRQDSLNLVNLHIRRYMEGVFEDIPPIFDQNWWSRVYKFVGIHPNAEQIPAFLARDQSLLQTFMVFQQCRRNPTDGEAYYDPDSVEDRTLEATMADSFARQTIQNVKEHLRALGKHIAKLWRAALEPRVNVFEARIASERLARAIIRHNPQPPADLTNLDIEEDYQTLREVFEAELNDIDLWQVYAHDIDLDMASRILNVSRWCLQQAENLQSQYRWSLLPLASHQVTNFAICTRTLALILRRRFLRHPRTAVLPDVLRRPNGNVIAMPQLFAVSGNPITQQAIWETVFNLNHVQPSRWRLGDNLNHVHLNAITFGFSMQSDGVMAHLGFRKPRLFDIEPIPTTRAQIRNLPEDMNLAEWQRGVYHLDKRPTGLNAERMANSRVVGVDPGVSSIITAAATQVEGTRRELWLDEIDVSSRSYHARTQVFWQYQKEIRNREKYGIQEEYDQIVENSGNVSDSQAFEQHIRVISQIQDRMKFFSAHFKHREIRATLASARQSTQHQIKNQLLGWTPPHRPDTKMHFIHRTTRRQRKRWHRYRRQAAEQSSGWVRNNLDTIIYWGDGEMPALPGFAPIPHVGLTLFVAKFALVVLTGEYMTSQVHSACDARLVPFPGTYIRSNHRMVRQRTETPIRHTRGRNIKCCANEDGETLHRRSLCPQGQQQGIEVWSLKRCVNHEHDVVIDRDRNAARNIRRIGLNYMITNGHHEHRPVALRRPQ